MPTVVFSRHQDPVRNWPDEMAGMLKDSFCKPRFGTPAKLPDECDVLSIWTRNPANIVENQNLRQSLQEYVRMGIPIELQVSVTGFGLYPFLELNVSSPEEIKDAIERVIDDGIVTRDMVKIRIDPVMRVELTADYGYTYQISNMDIALFEHMKRLFSDVASRFVSSHRDQGDYTPSMKKNTEGRSRILGIKVLDDNPDEVVQFFEKVAALFQVGDGQSVSWGICANPPVKELSRQACIDNPYFNRHGARRKLAEVKSKTRDGCACYKGVCSVRIEGRSGYYCYDVNSGCFFCYAQKGLGKAEKTFVSEVAKFKKDPEDYLKRIPESYRSLCQRVK